MEVALRRGGKTPEPSANRADGRAVTKRSEALS